VTPFPPVAAPPLEWSGFYIDIGGAPIPVPFQTKIPTLKGWQALRLTHEDVNDYFNGEATNVGLVLGDASHGLVDGDLDCREAVLLADRFLPPTSTIFGRKSPGASHRIWRVTPSSLTTTKFKDVEKGPDGERAMLVEDPHRLQAPEARGVGARESRASALERAHPCAGVDLRRPPTGGHRLRRVRGLGRYLSAHVHKYDDVF
jgi:hypothetical protein